MGASENSSEHPLAKAMLDFCLGHLSGASAAEGAQQLGTSSGVQAGVIQLQKRSCGTGDTAESQLPLSFSVTSVGGALVMSDHHVAAPLSSSAAGSGGRAQAITADGGLHAVGGNRERHLLTAMLPAAKETQVSLSLMHPTDMKLFMPHMTTL